MRRLNLTARMRACALRLLAVRVTLAAQTWYFPDSTIANKAIDCHYMNDERHLGRICVARQVLFDRQQQEPGQMLNMLGSTALLKLQFAQSPEEQSALNNTESQPLIQSAGFFGDSFLLPAPEKDIKWNCQQPGQLALNSQPVVFLVRDHAQLSHFLTVQVAPLYMALQAVGWEKRPFQLIVMDRESTHPALRSQEDFFINVLDRLSGTETLSLAHLPDSFCAREALIGVGTNGMLIAHDLLKLYEPQSYAEVERNRGAFAGMRDWVLHSYGLQYGVPQEQSSGDERSQLKPHFVFVDRGPGESRRIINQEDFAEAARKCGTAQIVQMQDYSFGEQLQLMQDTDILIATHGSAGALMVFLPPEAVTVELRAFKHSLTNDFTEGHSNLARASKTSMLIWNNRHAQHTRRWHSAPSHGDDNFKNQHTFIPDDQIDYILQAALQTWQTPMTARNFNQVLELNSAEPVA